MNNDLTGEERKAEEFLLKLRAGAVYAEKSGASVKIASDLILERLFRGKIDGAIWLLPAARLNQTKDKARSRLKDSAQQVEFFSFQSLSHNTGLFWQLTKLAGGGRRMLIIDDGLYIKNTHAVRTARVWFISQLCPYRLMLSGAPFERNQEDMFAQWYALDWRILGYRSYWSFSNNHLLKGRLINADYLSRAICPYSVYVRDEKNASDTGREYVWQFRLPDSVIKEYERVVRRFSKKAQYSSAGVYRMLRACHMVVSGMRITGDFPMKAEPIYENSGEDARLNALFGVLSHYENARVLVLCRYKFEMERVYEALLNKYGKTEVGCAEDPCSNEMARVNVESLYAEKNAAFGAFQAIVYYSQDWSLRKRRFREREREERAPGADVIDIVAADTIDIQMVRRVWSKEAGIDELYALLTEGKDK